jgi:hypothetical protein
MGIRERAEADARRILNNKTSGKGLDITVTDPTGASHSFVGWQNDIAELIDPDTQDYVSGRLVNVSLAITDLVTAGLEIPEGEPDPNKRPWVVEYIDLWGTPLKYAVARSVPDRGLGIVVLYLEVYA